MRKAVIKKVSLVFISLLLVCLAGLVGCGDDKKTGTSEITFGFLGDLTGPGAYAVGEVYYGLRDYFRMVDNDNPIPGVKAKVITFDTRSGYTRVPPGYEWLKGQGAGVIGVISGPDTVMLLDKFESDKIPSTGMSSTSELQGHPWNFALYSTPDGQQEAQAEVLLEWVMDNWDYQAEGRSPKIGHAGLAGFRTSDTYQIGVDRILAAYPDKFEWAGFQRAPMGSSDWTLEVIKLIDCDYIVLSMYGTSSVSFAKQARLRGYEGGLLSGMEAFPGYWQLVRTAVPADDLYDCIYAHYIPTSNDPGSFMTEVWEYAVKYHSEAEANSLMAGTGYPSGWAWGLWVTDAIRRAAEAVGAENVDGTAMREALASTDTEMVSKGLGNDWKIDQSNGVFWCAETQRIYEWSITEEVWISTGDWVPAPHLSS